MVKEPVNNLKTQKTLLNNTSNTPTEYNYNPLSKGSRLRSPPKKSRKQINQEYYQKNKERRITQEKERYQQQKELAEQQAKEQKSKYYGAKAYKVLMSLKEYTE